MRACRHKSELGFGLDILTSDFKVLRFWFLKNNHNIIIIIDAEIYKLSTNCWTKVDLKLKHIEAAGTSTDDLDRNAPAGLILKDMLISGLAPVGGVFMNGSCHWLGEYMGTNYILTFDFRSEIFGLIKFPHSRSDAGFVGLQRAISVLGDSLVLITEDGMRESFEVWAMLENRDREGKVSFVVDMLFLTSSAMAMLPDSSSNLIGSWRKSELGFGFDISTKDFKVIRLGLFCRGDDTPAFVHAEIYKLSTNSWTKVDFLELMDIEVIGAEGKYFLVGLTNETLIGNLDTLPPAGGVFVNGSCYWLGKCFTTYPILAFDFQTEVFGLIRCPCWKQRSWLSPTTLIRVRRFSCIYHSRW
ncbi:OLC1v1009839C1 [Oldenlandia corymbosa var. corymbosa]|uniref:OLC1v1009839C1 n=1 Tax=Oldenlandia corymbosa var. corymbosa TaxID=529605 RepID=A0AAV1DPX5_OLDCO|nr:OLC1v1009839C1 [Oldenlandia corymbosa var. corymbosa]